MKISSTLFVNVASAVLLAISKNIFAEEQYDEHNIRPDNSLVPIKDWFKMVSDPTTKCIESEDESLEGAYTSHPKIFEIVGDCTKNNSRWDYNIKMSKGTVKRGQAFNGYADITFAASEKKGNVQGKFKQGFKLGRCFLLSDNNIAQIRGNFKNDEIKGEITIKYQDGSFVVGNVGKENKFHGLLRYYDSNVKLQGIISVKKRALSHDIDDRALSHDIDDSDFLWKRLEHKKETTYKHFLLRSLGKDRVFIMKEEFDGVTYDCTNTESYFFDDCYEITELPLMNASTCNPLLDDKIAMKKRNSSILPFKYNMLQNDTYREGKSLYPFCKEEENFNKGNMRKSVETWWKALSFPDKDPIWFHSSSTEPFEDVDNPNIQINLNYFKGRKHLESRTYQIFSHTKLLHKGSMVNGKINSNISTWNVNDWAGPIKIVIAKHITGVMVDSDQLASQNFIIHGKLHRSKLHGLVRMFGTIPNDPEDLCVPHMTSGLGFLGHYKHGIPSGHCWKRLLGGPWIYGKVDENGLFSGDNIAYINQDVLTAFKGTFQNGVMIKAKAVEVIGERCNEEGIKIVEFSTPSTAQEYHFEKPTSKTFGDQPLVLDPLDRKYVRLGESDLNTGEKSQGIGQNGAFANVDIFPETVIAHNNGYILTNEEMRALKVKHEDLILKKEEFYKELEEDETVKNDTIATLRENLWKYRTSMKCGQLDIPYEEGQDPSIYGSTRGHKINHSFGASSAHLTFYDSARFGIVSSITSRFGVTIPKGTELFIHYGYNYSGGPRWYKKLFEDFLEESSETSAVNKFKDCHYADGTSMDTDQCNNYLHTVKNNLAQSFGLIPGSEISSKIWEAVGLESSTSYPTSTSGIKSLDLLDRLLKKHQEYVSGWMKRI